MSKPLSIACKAVGATVIIGAFVLVACLLSESSRTMYPISRTRGAPTGDQPPAPRRP